jgi:hypothetical protein
MVFGIGASLDGLDTLAVNRWVEEVLPSLSRSKVRVLYPSVRNFHGMGTRNFAQLWVRCMAIH